MQKLLTHLASSIWPRQLVPCALRHCSKLSNATTVGKIWNFNLSRGHFVLLPFLSSSSLFIMRSWMYSRCDYPLLFEYFLILPSLLHPSILFNCSYTCSIINLQPTITARRRLSERRNWSWQSSYWEDALLLQCTHTSKALLFVGGAGLRGRVGGDSLSIKLKIQV